MRQGLNKISFRSSANTLNTPWETHLWDHCFYIIPVSYESMTTWHRTACSDTWNEHRQSQLPTHHEAHHIDTSYNPRPSSWFLKESATFLVAHPPAVTDQLQPKRKRSSAPQMIQTASTSPSRRLAHGQEGDDDLLEFNRPRKRDRCNRWRILKARVKSNSCDHVDCPRPISFLRCLIAVFPDLTPPRLLWQMVSPADVTVRHSPGLGNSYS